MEEKGNISTALFISLLTSHHEKCLTVINKDFSISSAYSGFELLQKCLAMACHIKDIDDGRILLACNSADSFIAMLLASIFAGKVVIPSPVPRSSSQYNKLQSIARECGTVRVLCDENSANLIKTYQTEDLELQPVLIEQLRENTVVKNLDDYRQQLPGFNCSDKDVAYVQYSSGSYAAPKGVALSHRHVLANLQNISRVCGVDADTVFGTWLPLYHDMGLVSALSALIYGSQMVVMSPLAFIQKPVRWLQMITKFRVTWSGGPPFAYDLCKTHVSGADKPFLDLSSWKGAFLGAEIVRQDVVEAFVKAFESCGFDQSAAYATYGMAESTCYVAGSPVEQSDIAHALGAYGSAIRPCMLSLEKTFDICIVNSETREVVPDGEKGEIYISTDSMGYGYVTGVANGRLIIDSTRFEHQLHHVPSKTWFQTGDVGIKKGRALWVMGRKNDVFKINGENLLAAEVESLAAAAHPNLNAHGAAAFRVDDEHDHLANLLIETYARFDDETEASHLIKKIKSDVFAVFGLRLNRVVVLKRGALERTSSGKIRRNAIAESFSMGRYLNQTYIQG